MQRRSFIKGLTISSATVALPAVLMPNLSREYKIGIMVPLIKISGFDESHFNTRYVYQDQNVALAELKSGKIDYLITSPFFLIKDNPEFSLFGHFPTDLAHADKNTWVQNNYNFIQKHYRKINVQSEFLGLSSSQMLRMTDLNRDEFASLSQEGKRARMAANGGRAAWYRQVGYEVVKGPRVDNLGFQMEMIGRKRLNITEAFSPMLFIKAFEMNARDMFQPEFFKDHSLVLDTHSRRGLPLEVLSRPDSSSNAMVDIKSQLAEFFKLEEQSQMTVQNSLKEFFSKNLIDGFPESVVAQLENCKSRYLDELASYSETSAALVKNYRNQNS